MLDASHPLSHALSFHPTPPQQTRPYPSCSTFLASHLPSLIFPAVLHSWLRSPKMPIHCQQYCQYANVNVPAAADPQKTAVVGDNTHSCSPAPPRPQTHMPTPYPQRQPPIPSPSTTAVSCLFHHKLKYRSQHTGCTK